MVAARQMIPGVARTYRGQGRITSVCGRQRHSCRVPVEARVNASAPIWFFYKYFYQITDGQQLLFQGAGVYSGA